MKDKESSALELYTTDLTQRAREGRIDPVIGRDDEIRRVMQVLSRRSKNNPVLIGEPGVGKSAIVEGLALRIITGDVPLTLKNKKLVSIDLSSILAGASFKGEFEDRVKRLIKEILEAKGEIITFIDEIHTLVGAGGGGGALDAGNMFKPLLARGELRLIGATTLDEYREYIEKDAALERRFQQVIVNEPSVEETISILRGLKERYESHHKVLINDAALVASAVLSNRYITSRFLPDKAIDLIDEAASRLRMEIDSSPIEIDRLNREINRLTMERFSINSDKSDEKNQKLQNIEVELNSKKNELAIIEERWSREKEVLDEIGSLTRSIEERKIQAEVAQREGDFEKAAKIIYTEISSLEKKLSELQLESKDFLVSDEVGEDEIAQVISNWTKIPIGKLLKSEGERLLLLEKELMKRVVGQDDAVKTIANSIIRSRAGLADENKPNGSFIFLGPTGVGKTELAKAVAASIFDDEKALIRIDMSEYSEKFATSRLIGAPPGYIGYEEGGELTEAVRRRPYCVILLDEIEKAHRDVFDVLLQVLDDGRLTDSHGRVVDFKNTILIMTSNLASEELLNPKPDINIINLLIKQFFKPEFLNRVDALVTFNSLGEAEIREIIKIELKKVENLLNERGIEISIESGVVDWLFLNGFDPAYGARPIKRLIERSIKDPIAKKILSGSERSFSISSSDLSKPDLDINPNK